MSSTPAQGQPTIDGRIVLAATPIGNLGDASHRLIQLLGAAQVIAAEDTRRLKKLVEHLGITTEATIYAYHEHNEAEATQKLIAAAQQGQLVLVVSDAGMPLISDPGFALVQAAQAAGVPLTVAPGASAVLAALALSGLPSDRFSFEGFLPRKEGARQSRLAEMSAYTGTLIYFEAPHRIEKMLEAVGQVLGGQRGCALVREITKTYEEVRTGTVAEVLASVQQDPPRGEIVVVLAGASGQSQLSVAEATELVLERVSTGEKLSQAAKTVAKESGLSRHDIYQAAIAASKN